MYMAYFLLSAGRTGIQFLDDAEALDVFEPPGQKFVPEPFQEQRERFGHRGAFSFCIPFRHRASSRMGVGDLFYRCYGGLLLRKFRGGVPAIINRTRY